MSAVRSERYLAIVRQHPCLYCSQTPSEAHHPDKKRSGGGMGMKGCDMLAVPLCTKHHGEFHKRRCIGVWTVDETEERFLVAQVFQLRSALISGFEP